MTWLCIVILAIGNIYALVRLAHLDRQIAVLICQIGVLQRRHEERPAAPRRP